MTITANNIGYAGNGKINAYVISIMKDGEIIASAVVPAVHDIASAQEAASAIERATFEALSRLAE